MISTEVLVEDDRWNQVSNIEELVKKAVEISICKSGFKSNFSDIEVSISLVNNKKSQQLNKQFRSQDKPTNVLSFPAEEIDPAQFVSFKPVGNIVALGDIFISYDVVLNESEKNNKKFKDHFCHLIVHGILHLLGFDHQTESEAVKMEAKEVEILKFLGINSPYAL
jgi:probable rRNA maturation factor